MNIYSFDEIIRDFYNRKIAITVNKGQRHISMLWRKLNFIDDNWEGDLLYKISKSPDEERILLCDFDDVLQISEDTCKKLNIEIINYSDILTSTEKFKYSGGGCEAIAEVLEGGVSFIRCSCGMQEIYDAMDFLTGGEGNPSDYGDH